MEEPHAVEQAEAIAAVPGVDMLMLGPADFTVLTGIPGEFDAPDRHRRHREDRPGGEEHRQALGGDLRLGRAGAGG